MATMIKYRTFWPRFWAGWIDGLVFLPVSLFDNYLSSPERGSAVIVLWAAFSYSSYWLYSVFFHARYGQTPGKMATRVRVLDVTEERTPTFRQAFMRDIGYIALNSLTLVYLIYLVLTHQYVQDAEIDTTPGWILTGIGAGWFLLEIITMLTNRKRRAFHDFIARTVVTRCA